MGWQYQLLKLKVRNMPHEPCMLQPVSIEDNCLEPGVLINVIGRFSIPELAAQILISAQL